MYFTLFDFDFVWVENNTQRRISLPLYTYVWKRAQREWKLCDWRSECIEHTADMSNGTKRNGKVHFKEPNSNVTITMYMYQKTGEQRKKGAERDQLEFRMSIEID